MPIPTHNGHYTTPNKVAFFYRCAKFRISKLYNPRGTPARNSAKFEIAKYFDLTILQIVVVPCYDLPETCDLVDGAYGIDGRVLV